jgi:catechol 2,3-dioxygenase-like lactoylglutathione lyase family enzyme
MPAIRHFDHVGITVRDLDTVTAFFAGLGSETKGQAVLEGEFPDAVIGIPNARTEIVMLRPPGGGTGLELPGFIRPDPWSAASVSTRASGAWRLCADPRGSS